MTYVLALLAGIAGAIIGYAASGSVAAVLANVMGMSNFEGAIGYFAFFGIGPIGGLVGLIAGIWIVLHRRGFRAGAIAGRGVIVIAAIAVLVAGTLALFYVNRSIIAPNSLPPQLMFEIRLPPGVAPADQSDISIMLDTDKNSMPAWLAKKWVRTEDGRAILSGGVELYYRTSQRILALRFANGPTELFTLKLAASPKYTEAFGDWHRVDFVHEPGAEQPRRADASSQYEIRYYVEDRSIDRTVAIDFEIRLPEGTPLPQEAADLRIALRTDDQEYEGNFLGSEWKRQDGARTVLTGGMGIPDPRANPRVLFALPGGPVRVFPVALPGNPRFGGWQRADVVEEDGRNPRPDDQEFEFRYAVR